MIRSLLLLPLLASFAACFHAPPIAPAHDHVTTLHGETRNDPYDWLRNRESPETLEYLRAENRYFERHFSPLRETRSRILAEMKSRLDEDESTAPARDGPYLYYSRYVPGADFQLICRKPAAGGPEEILLDPNERARGKAYYQNQGWATSDDHRYLAFAEDFVGRRFFTIRFKDTRTGQLLPDAISDVTSNFVWENDGKTLLYVKQDPGTLRWDRVFRHVLGQPRDQELYREADETFEVRLTKALNRKAIFLGIESTLTRDVRILDPSKPGSRFAPFAPRVKGHEYWLAHGGDRYFIATNDHARNFRLMEAPLGRTERKDWKEVVAHRKDAYIDAFLVLRDQVALVVLKDGLPRIELRDRANMGEPRLVRFDDPAYSASFGDNLEYETRALRLQYESLRIPETAYDLDLATGARTLVLRKKVLGGFDPERYVSRRLFVKARDGARVPVSLIHRKDLEKDGKNPLLIDGYGAYGSSSNPEFSSSLVSLYDRGFVYAIAHVRGGSELGRPWYEDGRQKRKMNSFTDLID
ncbi:MAG TPA: prolyl oligopeptidase family serine peptidase, partial [Bdellovibrionota bacterium]|nr:prolyl oligopeptidase family serine peptidase [Bdellovibrionota bacterium]